MNALQKVDSEIYDSIKKEEQRQSLGLELIASENYISKAVMEAMGTVLNNKYSEGYIGKRYYAGNEVVDEVENLAIERAKALFGADHANVQPLSGSPANAAVYFATLNPGDKVMGLKLTHGGHLSHGHPINFSGLLYNFVQYGVDEETGLMDMDKIREIALKERPKILVVGFSAYSRNVDWKTFKIIADEINAITFADIAHVAGLIAGKVIDSPVPYFDIVTTTTHKTLRGPRGAIILCKDKYKQAIDRSVFPGLQGGPHDHITAAKAVCFKEAATKEFQKYSADVIKNAKALSAALMARGYKILTDGTDNHLMVVDLRNKEMAGRDAEIILDKVGISISRSTIPGDTRKAMNPSGIRLGTPAVTTRGMTDKEMADIAGFIDQALCSHNDEKKLARIKESVEELCKMFPLTDFIPR
ncbi:MAG: serine hydroxymethyltransferase [Fibrobacteria bacterium]|nr:serine hydroxymethyltransferase [Fibrobacteria bacterium]